ncbi:unnamed protein product [Hydatigera taeniaeformis]|uniref:Uncharacterized protein n=1 Tax=Hydatigena taeniaeformis TaxID=6205 RepID=A0A0R3WNT5_HYDTA|nr:unnamed protein product [Hydatigera taeniaeformis]
MVGVEDPTSEATVCRGTVERTFKRKKLGDTKGAKNGVLEGQLCLLHGIGRRLPQRGMEDLGGGSREVLTVKVKEFRVNHPSSQKKDPIIRGKDKSNPLCKANVILLVLLLKVVTVVVSSSQLMRLN